MNDVSKLTCKTHAGYRCCDYSIAVFLEMINIKQDSMMIICCRHILTCTTDSTTVGVGVKCGRECVDGSFDVGLDFKSI